MSWTIRLVYGIIITSVTGGILTVLWYLLGLLLEKLGFINIVFELLKVVLIFFFLPVTYIALWIGQSTVRLGRGYLFQETNLLMQWSGKLLHYWMLGVAVMLGKVVVDVWRVHRKLWGAIPCAKEVEEQFGEVGRRFGRKKVRLSLCQSYHVTVPCVTGLLRPKLILPIRNFTRAELEVIFTHELTHYLQRDVILKWLTVLMRAFHFFNPLVWLYSIAVQRWSEYACDFKACRESGGMKHYFQVITNISVQSSAEVILSSSLLENYNQLKQRIIKMKKVMRVKAKPGWCIPVISAAAVITSSVTVSAAALESVDQYFKLYQMTEVGMEDFYSKVALGIEYKENANPEKEQRIGEVQIIDENLAGFDWVLSDGGFVATSPFDCEVDEVVHVYLRSTPQNMRLKVGLVDPNGDKRYIMGTSVVNHDFFIVKSGQYKVFVIVDDNKSVAIKGSYGVYNVK